MQPHRTTSRLAPQVLHRVEVKLVGFVRGASLGVPWVCPRRKPGGTLTSHISWHRRCSTVWPVFVDQAHPERKLGCTLCLCDKSDDNGGHAGMHHVGISSIVISMLIDDTLMLLTVKFRSVVGTLSTQRYKFR